MKCLQKLNYFLLVLFLAFSPLVQSYSQEYYLTEEELTALETQAKALTQALEKSESERKALRIDVIELQNATEQLKQSAKSMSESLQKSEKEKTIILIISGVGIILSFVGGYKLGN
jgi:septal ring factor EnvC (AmiA/AmiB activator)